MAPAASPAPETFGVIGDLADQGAIDSSFFRPKPAPENGPFRFGSKPPAYGRQELKLSEENLTSLGVEYCELLDDYDRVMQPRWLIEEDINASYAQRPDPIHRGVRPGDANLVSEMTCYICDQITARITSNMRSVTPLARVQPITGGEYGDLALKFAQATERFLEEYGARVMKLPQKLSQAVHRAVKVGTAVFKVDWEVETREVFSYRADSSKAERKSKEEGRVKVRLIPNRLVKVWPPSIWDWQEDYLFVGHDTFLTRGQWRELAGKLKLSAELTREIENTAGWERDHGEDEILSAQDVERRAMANRSDELIRITELYCHDVLPGQTKRGRYQVFLSRPLRKAFWVEHNRFHTQKHSYFPLRFKFVDELAWGNGAGHELLFPQAAGTAMQNIQMDSLMSGCYHVVVRLPDYIHQTQTIRPMHGQVIPSPDPSNDFIPRKLGGEVPELGQAMQDNDFRGMKLAGVPPVLGGLGDPIQKSGTGTGATAALIEQAGKKHGYTDTIMRDDFTALLQFLLEMVAQYAPEGLYYQYASEPDADSLQLLKYTPPRGEMGELFKISVQAPNAATSRESRRQAWLLLYQFLRDHLMVWTQQAVPYLQQTNPAAINRLLEQVLSFQAWLAQQLVEDYELPGAKDYVPTLPPPIPTDQVINDLTTQLTQAQSDLETAQQYTAHLTAQLQALLNGQPMPAEPAAAMPPAGAPAEPPMSGEMPMEMPVDAMAPS